MFEEYIGGQEIQAAVINKTAIGAIELIPKRLFYDYKAKYTKSAKTKHIMPARLSKKNYAKVLNYQNRLTKHWDVKVLRELILNILKTNFIF